VARAARCESSKSGKATEHYARPIERPTLLSDHPTRTDDDTPVTVLPIAIDAMGGDNAPGAIVEGAQRAVAELGVPVVLVGRPEDVDELRDGLDLVPASQVIGMDADPGSSVRTMKDSSLVRAAEAVRDGKASAMVSAGNTGATMASALLRMGRIKGVARPAIATPIPVPGATPTVLLDAGANAECQPQWLVQFAQMGAVFARERYGIAEPRVGLLSIGEEATKGSPLVKETHALLAADGALDRAGARFLGNVEGRDIMTDGVDVVVTDGFTGNVALKTLEGGMKALVGAVLGALGATDVADRAFEALMPLYATVDPDQTGGAMLLGVDGVCIISHGSSSATAIVNAARVAHEMIEADLVERLRSAVAPA
jgi:phosphate acyltransferase